MGSGKREERLQRRKSGSSEGGGGSQKNFKEESVYEKGSATSETSLSNGGPRVYYKTKGGKWNGGKKRRTSHLIVETS